jgi:hypothetical protein
MVSLIVYTSTRIRVLLVILCCDMYYNYNTLNIFFLVPGNLVKKLAKAKEFQKLGLNACHSVCYIIAPVSLFFVAV